MEVGKNANFLQVPFLNLMSNIQQRAGRVDIRLGGGIVDFASLVDNLGSDQTEAVLFGTADIVSARTGTDLEFYFIFSDCWDSRLWCLPPGCCTPCQMCPRCLTFAGTSVRPFGVSHRPHRVVLSLCFSSSATSCGTTAFRYSPQRDPQVPH